MPDETWPPSFTLDQERILNLLTGDRFYSNPSAALREAILNAIDAVHRLRKIHSEISPQIIATFNRDDLTLAVVDNGVGMSRSAVSALFTKVGASAATAEAAKESVGEFGIGVISYFMAGDEFTLHTFDGVTEPVGLSFSRKMLAGGEATEISPTQHSQGTTLKIQIKDASTFSLLLESFPSWCRNVEGLSGVLIPDAKALSQGGSDRSNNAVAVKQPPWVERAHLGPVSDPTGWDAMTAISTVAVLYRGVFVQEFDVKGAWGIKGSIDVDPKHFMPRLNREGFVEGQFQSEVEAFLQACHPTILEAMAGRLAAAVQRGDLDKWTEKRWANLWLSVPRSQPYIRVAATWDAIFRSLPAFELAVGNQWEPLSLEKLMTLHGNIFVAPLANEKSNDVVQAAVRLLRNTGKTVIRGIRRDQSWMKFAGSSYNTTADLITSVFASELPPLKPIVPLAEQVLASVAKIAPLFTGPPAVDLVRIGSESPPVLKLRNRLVINVDHKGGKAIVEDTLHSNTGPLSLIGIAARHSYEQMTQVAAVMKDISGKPEILSPIRRRFIRSLLC